MHIDDIEKARAGIYKDTVENRHLGRVGQRYGREKSLEEFRQNQVNLHNNYKSFIEDVAKEIGALALVAPPKALDRAREKMVEEYGGDFTKIKDILRSQKTFT